MTKNRIVKSVVAVVATGLITCTFLGNSWTTDYYPEEPIVYTPTARHKFAVDGLNTDYVYVSVGNQIGESSIDNITQVISEGYTDGELYSGNMYFFVNYSDLRTYSLDAFSTIYEYTITGEWLPVPVLLGLWQADVNVDSVGTFEVSTLLRLRAGNNTKMISALETWQIDEYTYVHNRTSEEEFLADIAPYIRHTPNSCDYVYVDSYTYRLIAWQDTIQADTIVEGLVTPFFADEYLYINQYNSDIEYLMEQYTNVIIEEVTPIAPIDLLFSPIESFMKLELFPGFNVETLFIIVVAIGVFGVFLKFYAGG